MKILVIYGVQKGNTYERTKAVIKEFVHKQDVEWVEVSVDDFQLPVCNACQACVKKGQDYCPKFRAFAIAQAGMATCDAVILSGIGCIWAWSKIIQNGFDRLISRNHRPQLLGKQGMAVTASSGRLARHLKKVLHQWGISDPLIFTEDEVEKMQRAIERFYQMLIS